MMKRLASIATRSGAMLLPQQSTRSKRKRRRPAMMHLGIDLGGRESQFCLRTEKEQIVEEGRQPTAELQALLERVPRCRVILETCAEAFAVADLAMAQGHEVRVVPATLVRSLGVGARRTKTDRRDTRVLSEVSCRIDLPSVHVPSPWARETKTQIGMRQVLVENRTRAINAVLTAAATA